MHIPSPSQQASRLQVFASSPSLHFSVHLSFLIISCFCTRVLVSGVALHRKRIPKSMQSNLLSTLLHLKLKKSQGLTQNFKDFSRENVNQGLFKDSIYNSRTFKTVRTLHHAFSVSSNFFALPLIFMIDSVT